MLNENLGHDEDSAYKEELDKDVIIRYSTVSSWFASWTEFTILRNGTTYFIAYQYYIDSDEHDYTLQNGLLIENKTMNTLNESLIKELNSYLNLTKWEYDIRLNNLSEVLNPDVKKFMITNFSKSKLSSSEVDTLIELFHENNFFHLKYDYDDGTLDGSVSSIYFSDNDKIKRIREIENSAPYEYNIIQDRLEKIQSETYGTKYYKQNFGQKKLFPVFNIEFVIICVLFIVLVYIVISRKKRKK